MLHSSRIPLARATGIEVDACDCGTIHLTIGALTLRLDPAAFGRLSATLAEAVVTRAFTAVRGGPEARLPV
jgi:hypothetical protein